MIQNYKEKLKSEIRSTESSFFTVLKNLNYDTSNDTQNDTQNDGQSEGEKLKPKERREKITQIMKDKRDITALELSKLFFISISTIERDLKKLTDEKIIESTGSAKDGYWIVKK